MTLWAFDLLVGHGGTFSLNTLSVYFSRVNTVHVLLVSSWGMFSGFITPQPHSSGNGILFPTGLASHHELRQCTAGGRLYPG